MPTIDVSYDRREMIRAPDLPFEPDVGVELDYRHAFGIPLSDDYVVLVIPAQGLLGPESERHTESPLLQTEMTAGVVIGCLQEVFTIETEPTGDDTFGFLGYSDRRKPIVAGSGRVSATGEPEIEFACASVYDRVTSSPRTDTSRVGCSGNVRTGEWECSASVTVNW